MSSFVHRSWLKSFCRKLLANRVAGNRESAKTRLSLEALESRVTPTTWTVNSALDPGTGTGTAGSLRYDLTNSVAGDTITFASTLSASTITLASASGTLTIGHNITITGLSGSSLTISGNAAIEVFSVPSGVTASIQNLTITKGKTTLSGGGILNKGTLSLSGVTLSSNTATKNGGAIYNSAGSVTLTTVSLTSNAVTGNSGAGGAIYNTGGTVTISGSTFTSNTAAGQGSTTIGGGAIYNTGGTVTISGSTFTSNVESGSNGLGGAIDNSTGGTVTISGSTLTSNSVTASSPEGGAIYDSGLLTITNSTLTGNSAKQAGGAIYSSGTVTISGSTLSGNSTSTTGTNGGAVDNTGIMTIYGSTLSGNSAEDDGGAILSSNELSLVNSTLYGNTAKEDGGGLINDGGTVYVTNSTITGNSTTGNSYFGGGIFNNSSMTLTNAIVAGNHDATYPDIDSNRVWIANDSLIGTSNTNDAISTAAGSGTGNIIGTSANLATSLGNNGGTTQTVALIAPSPALFAGSSDTTVTSPIGMSDTTIQVASAAAIACSAGAYPITIDNEEMLVTGVNLSTNTLTVQRGYAGTITTHSANTGVYLATDQRGDPNDSLISMGAYSPSPSILLVTDPGSGPGSATDVTLPYAVATTDANSLGLIQFASSLSGDVITLNSALTLTNPATITGLGASELAVSGYGFRIASGVSATITGLTIENASANTGGGIHNAGTLTLANDDIIGNSAQTGGGIYNTGSLTMTNIVVSNNVASKIAGGIYNTGKLTLIGGSISGNSASSSGGGIFNAGTLTMSGSSLTGNSAVKGGGIFSMASVALSDTPITGNTASGSGSGIYADGSGAAIAIAADTTIAISNDIYCLGSPGMSLTGSGAINMSGNINLGALGNITDSASANDTISGRISGTATSPTASINALTITGSGTLTLSNINTYTGATTIDHGTLLVTQNGETGPSTAAGIFIAGGTLALSGSSDYTEPITFTGSGTGGVGALANLSGNNILGAAFSVAGTATLGLTAGSLTIDGPISLPGSSSLTTSGSGSLAIGNSITVPGMGTALLANDGTQPILIPDAINVTGAAVFTIGGTSAIDISGNINLGALGNLNVTSTGAVSISGAISGTATSSTASVQGLTGQYYDLASSSQSNINPATSGNASWLGNLTPAVTSTLFGPIDFSNILSNGFLDTQGNQYYDPTPGDNLNVQARWSGYITIPASSSSISFYDASSIPSIVYINGTDVADTLTTGSNGPLNTVSNLTPGQQYTIDVECYDPAASSALVELMWDPTGSGLNFSDIPNTAFSTTAPINSVAMNGSGTLTLTNTNPYLGYTGIFAGTVIVNSNSALGSTSAAGIVVKGGTLGLSGGFNYTNVEPISISGSGANGAGAIESISGNNTFSVVPTTSGSIYGGAAAGATLTVAIPLTLPTGTSLTAEGAGTVDLIDPIGVVGTGSVSLGEGGSGTLNISGSITLPYQSVLNLTGSGTINITNNIYLDTLGSLDVASSGAVTIGGVISGTASSTGVNDLTMTGSGTLDLTNTNTYTGYTDIDAGTVIVAANDITGPSSASGIVVNGGTLALSGGFDYTDTEPLTISGSGANGAGAIANINGNSTLSVAPTISGSASLGAAADTTLTVDVSLTLPGGTSLSVVGAGTVNFSQSFPVTGVGIATLANDGTQPLSITQPINVSGQGTFTIAGTGVIDISGPINLGAQGNLSDTASADDTISGLISGTATSPTASVNGLTMTGTGTLTLSDINTYTGATNIDSGALLVTQNGETGPASAAGIFVDGGTLALSGGFDYTDAEAITVSGAGAIESISGNNTLSVAPNFSGSASLAAAAGATLTVESSLVLSTGTSLTANGAGTVDITDGTIASGAGSVSLGESGSGTLNISDPINLPYQTILNLTGSGTVDITNNINLEALGSLTDSSTGNITVTGVISSTGTSPTESVQGLTGDYYNIATSSQSSIDPATSSNASWLGNQTPAATSTLVGPIDFQNIGADGFLDTQGNQYYNPTPGANQNLEARWSGDITIPASSPSVSFYDASNIPSIVYINGVDVVDTLTGSTNQLNTISSLTPGQQYTIDVECYDAGSPGAAVEVLWDPSGGENFSDIPNSAFTTTEPIYAVTMNGAGTLTLTNTNNYLGETNIDAGTLIVNNNGAMGPANAAGTFINGGTLGLTGGFNYTDAEPITVSAAGAGGAIESVSGNNTLSVTPTFSGSASYGATAGATLTVDISQMVIAAGTSLTATGAGTVDFINGTITVGAGLVSLGESGTGTLNISDPINLSYQNYLNLTGTGTINIMNSINLGALGGLNDSSTGNINITGTISGTAATGAQGESYASLVLANPSLTGYYPLNDAAGSTTVADLSSNHVAGTLVNSSGLTLGVPGAFSALGSAASFTGTSYIDTNTVANLGLDTNTYSLMAWVYPTTGNEAFFGNPNGGALDANLQFGVEGGLFFGEYDADTATSTTVPLNQWDFIAATFSNGTESVYLNGVLVGQTTGNAELLASAGVVALHKACCQQQNTADMQQAAFFDSALSSEEISALYAVSGLPLAANTVAMTGSGSLTLTNTNSYAGQTYISGGTLIVNSNSAMGPTTAAGIVVSGGTLGLTGGFNYTDAEPITISGAGANGAGAVESISGNNTFSVASAFSGSASFGAAAGATLNVPIPQFTLAGGTYLTASGAGTVDILSGTIAVGAGSVSLGENGSGTLNISDAINLPNQSYLNLTGTGTLNIKNTINLGALSSLFSSSSGNVNISGAITGTAVSGAQSSSFSNLIQANSTLTGYYPLNDAPGSSTVADLSNNHVAGTIVGTGLTLGVPGAFPAFGTTASFNGSSYIDVNSAANLGLDSNSWTALAWVYTTTSTNESFIGTPTSAAGTDTDLHLILRSGDLYFGEYNDDSSDSTALPLNQWNLITFTFSSGTQSIYVNGSLVHQSTGHNELQATGPVAIGATQSDLAPDNDGDMQQVAFFDSALSSLQIAALYAAAELAPAANTVANTSSGTLTLGNTNSYAGPTDVYGGTLQVNGSITSSSGVAVSNGAVLSGTGSTSAVVGGSVSPGNTTNPTGTLTVASANLAGGGNVTVALAGATGSVVGGVLDVTGTLTLGGTSTLTLNVASLTGYTNNPITIITAGSITGQFSAINFINNPDDDQFTVNYTSTTVTVTMVPFSVGTVTATPADVELLFTDGVNPASTVLYSSPGDTTLGSANILVTGPNGVVRGSLVIDATNSDMATFVPTAGLLPAGTYMITIGSNVSAANGMALPGAFSQTVSISTVTTPALSISSFARGPGQSVALPDTLGNTSGIPLNISNATDATAVSFTLTYDPTLLTIASSGALTLSSLATAAGINTIAYSINNVDAHHSVLTVTLTSSGGGSGLTATTAETLVTITANVPDSAPYKNKSVLNLESVTVNGAPATGVLGVDVAAYLGDVLGTGVPNATDASLVDQVGSGAGTGFSVFQDLDPAIIGGVDGHASVNANDASLINEAASGETIPQIPAVPTLPAGVSLTFGGPDPYLYLSAIQGVPGQTVTETLYLDVTDPNGIQLTALDEAIGFDAGELQISNVRSALGLLELGSYATANTVNNSTGVLLVGQAFMGTGLPPVVPYGTDVAVLQFDVTLSANAAVGSQTGLTLLEDGTINGQIKYTAISDNEGALTWTDGKAPSNSGNAAVDGSVTVVSAVTPAGTDVVTSSPQSPVLVAPKAVEPLRKGTTVKASSQSAVPTVTGVTSVIPSSELVDLANSTEELVVTSVGPLQPSPLATMVPEANLATGSALASPPLASEVVETANLVSSVARSADSGASLSVAAMATNKASPVGSTASSSVKTSTSVLDEMYRQLGTVLTVPSGYDYNLIGGGSPSAEDSENEWTFEELLIDLD